MSMQIAVQVPSAVLDAAIAQNAGLNLEVSLPPNLGGYGNARSIIKSIVLVAEENLDWDLLFFGTTTHGLTYDTDTYLGHALLAAASAIQFSTDAIASAWRYAVQDVDLPYANLNTPSQGGGLLHLTVVPRNAAHVIHKKIIITLYLAPEVPWSGA